MSFINQSPLNYPPNSSSSIRIYKKDRAPTSNDYANFVVGDEWWDTSSDDFYKLVAKTTTSGTWRIMAGTSSSVETFTTDDGNVTGPDGFNNIILKGDTAPNKNGMLFTSDPVANSITAKDLRNITKYVVDPTGAETEYQTIQAALDEANTNGGNALVVVRPGTYTENLTLYDSVHLQGANEQATIIIGTHTPPASGNFNAFRCTFQSATDIFSSAIAGTSALVIEDCTFNVTNGYVFNLLNWTGSITVFDIGSIGTNDGVVNNTGGATVFLTGATLGAGTGNIMTVSGSTIFENVNLKCPISLQGSGTSTIKMGCEFNGTITTAATNSVTIINSEISTGATAAISHGSANTLTLSDVTIDSSNNPAIDGAGAGAIIVGSITFLNNSAYNGALTLDTTTLLNASTLRLSAQTANAVPFFTTAGLVSEIGPMNDGQFVIGATAGAPAAGTITSTGGTITVTPGTNTINLDLAGGGVAIDTITGNVGGPVSADGAGNVDIPGNNGILTSFDAANILRIDMNSPFTGDFTFTDATAGVTEALTVSNTDNTNAASHAVADIVTGGASGGDPFLHLEVTGATEYSLGIDNTDSDKLKLTDGADPSNGNERITVQSTGEVNVREKFRMGEETPTDTADQAADAVLSKNEVGDTVNFVVRNVDNTNSASHSIVAIANGGDSGGDPTVQFNSGTPSFGMGIDTSDSKKFKFGYIALGTPYPSDLTPYLVFTTTGAANIPNTLAVGAETLGTDVYLQNSQDVVGNDVGTYTVNTDNTNTASHAFYSVATGGESGGDPFYLLDIGSADFFSIGMDNTDSNFLKITDSNQGPSAGSTFMTVGNNGVKDFISFFDGSAPADIDQPSVDIADTIIGGNVGIRVTNNDNTDSTSDCAIGVVVGGASSGDPCFTMAIGVVNQFYTLGIDNSDSDTLKITDGATPSQGNTLWSITTGGAVTFNNAFTFPTTDGTVNQVLTTDGTGTITWGDADIQNIGTGQTVGAVTADLVTIALGATPTTYSFDVLVAGFESTTPAGVGYTILASVRTTGAAAVIVATNTNIAKEEAALATAACDLIVSGNNVIIQATGVAALTIDWKARVNYISVI